MAQQKFHTYLLYAIGEVFLVVIGILIALQVNNWNENNQKAELRNEYTLSMIEDLRRDTTQIKSLQEYNKRQNQELDSLWARIQIEKPNIRNLVQMNFTPNLSLLSDLNNSTFNALINSGNIDLYDKEIRDVLIEHQGTQENYIESYELNEKVFYETMNTFLQTAPVYSQWLTGEVSEKVWAEVDLAQLAISFNALLIQKRFLLGVFDNKYDALYSSTMNTLNMLEKEVK